MPSSQTTFSSCRSAELFQWLDDRQGYRIQNIARTGPDPYEGLGTRLDFNVCVSIDNIYGVSVWKWDLDIDNNYNNNNVCSI